VGSGFTTQTCQSLGAGTNKVLFGKVYNLPKRNLGQTRFGRSSRLNLMFGVQ